MNTATILTERLILRRFDEGDIPALFEILSDEEVNTFLPWFLLKTVEEARVFYERRYLACYEQGRGCAYAVCLRTDDIPVGYIGISGEDNHDLGYGLKKNCWGRGIMTEAGRAVLRQARQDNYSYVTATHDVNNPRSGNVMRRIGMRYQYSYEEIVMPKNVRVTFRMYQINFDPMSTYVYRGYSDDVFVEDGI